jgi:hypothetical protein
MVQPSEQRLATRWPGEDAVKTSNDAGNQRSAGISDAIARSIGWMVGIPRMEIRRASPHSGPPATPAKPVVDVDAPTEKLDPDA